MQDLKKHCRLAIVQAEPILFDKAACVAKAVQLIGEAAAKGAEFNVFPELFIPGYPVGMTFGFTVGKRDEGGREDWKRYYDNSVVTGGEETRLLSEAAKRAGAYVSIGFSERDGVSGTLYNSNMIFGPTGELLSLHRKIKPTGSERVVWGDGNKGYFPVVATPWGPVGVLICWETYMPLARVALYEKGVSIYISANTNDNEEWQSTIRHVAIEGHCYFINADLLITKESYPKGLHEPERVASLERTVCRGGSSVIDPYGHVVAGPVWDKEDIIIADLDMDEVAKSRMEFDACGHYSRPDIFTFRAEEK